ncbi:protease modulator HflC [Oryzibacter oryziterrae]|uniref:protease modulator HflC n=1 Tax=Oryzibacter oryziterrae TaxID=2766474 RepID=UPI001F46491C|nr:protease modulator HflC [Oryzibacter oryziterrae]
MRALAMPVTLIVAAVALIVLYSSVFIVTERDQAIQLRFGEIQRVITEPGIYFKLPTTFVDTVQIVDKRLQTLELDNNVVQVKDSRQYVVDAFAAYRITDVKAFRESVSGNMAYAADRLKTRLDSALRRVYGTRPFSDALSEERSAMMKEVADFVRPEAATLGIEIVELRIRRTELPANVLDQTYERMKAERSAEAAELRAEGKQEADRIRAEADRQATVLVAEAKRDADILHGEGDAERNRIFADAYGKDKDFFEFYRTMQAYQASLGGAGTTMVLKPEGEFFRFFGSADGKPAQPAPVAQ